MTRMVHGLSPNFFSMISPNIPESLVLRWVFVPERKNETQSKATVRVYRKNNSTSILTLMVDGEKEVSIAHKINTFNEEGEYEWEVEATSSNGTKYISEKASFRFAKVEMNNSIEWPDGPQPYEYIGSRKYFSEIRENVISVLGDYVLSSNDEIDVLLSLSTIFTGQIVPSKDDFKLLEKALHIIAEKEYTVKQEIRKFIEDGLGASDIHQIYKLISTLSQIPPYQPTNFSISVNNPPMYQIKDALIKNTSSDDTGVSIQTEWQTEKLTEGNCYITFEEEINKDVSYYKLDVITGFEDAMIIHSLYYRVKDLNKIGNKIYFQSRQHEYKNISSSLKGICGFDVQAIDKRGQKSINYSIIQPAPQIRLGFSHYILQNEIHSLTGAAVIKPYVDNLYEGSNNRYIHHLSGDISGFYHYRVKVVDKNGDESNWFEFGPIKIDSFVSTEEDKEEVALDDFDEEDFFKPFSSETPKKQSLLPPSIVPSIIDLEIKPVLAPPKPIVAELTNNTALITWKAVKNADRYEIKLNESVVTTDTSYEYENLKDECPYSVMVRSINKDTYSEWITVSFITPSKPILSKESSITLSKCWRSDYQINYANGHKAYLKGGWRKDIKNEIIQGEWVELQNNRQSGSTVQAGTRWGNHKSIFMIDIEDWATHLDDKEIIKVELYIKRVHNSHGYANDGKSLYLYTHSHLTVPVGEPILENCYEVKNHLWSRGQGNWVTLPIKFGELIKNKKIAGFALHHPIIHVNPPSNYSYCKFDANSIKLRIYYK